MNSTFKKVLSMLLVLTMALSLVACGGSGDEGESGGTDGDGAAKTGLVVALPGEPTTIDPYAHSLYYGFIPATQIFDTLITKDDSGEFVSELATSWEFTDDTTLLVELREGVTFHNGNPFTADDVKYTLEIASTNSFSSSLFAAIDNENTTVVDDKTIEIKLLYPYAPLLETLASFRACIIDKETYEADPAAYGREPVGTGPMMIGEWHNGDRIELVANDSYWGDALAYETCTYRVIVEASSRTIELETAGIDIAVDVPYSDWTRVEDDPNMILEADSTNTLASLVFNNSLEMFQDERVRQALAHGLNLDALVSTVWEGTATPADTYYAPSMIGYKSVGPYEYDVELAKELLAEAGYPNGFDFKFTTYQTTLNQAFAEVVESMWGEIGVNITIDVVDLATFTEMNNGGQLTAALMTPNISISDPAAALVLWPISRTISLRHNDQHIQDLMDQGSSTYDDAERTAIYGELQDYLFEKTYTVPIAYSTVAFGTRADVEGFVFQPSQIPDMTTIYFN